MELKKYKELALRTASRPKQIGANIGILYPVLNIFLQSSKMLDVLKKNMYYGKPFDKTKLILALRSISDSLNALQQQTYEPQDQTLVNTDLITNIDAFHGLLGIATEAGELIELIRFNNVEIDTKKIKDESGDVSWYINLLLSSFGIQWEDVLDTNIDKLGIRYKDNEFNAEHVLNKDVKKEDVVFAERLSISTEEKVIEEPIIVEEKPVIKKTITRKPRTTKPKTKKKTLPKTKK